MRGKGILWTSYRVLSPYYEYYEYHGVLCNTESVWRLLTLRNNRHDYHDSRVAKEQRESSEAGVLVL